jgi:polyisoprenoid-binding protein YceI
MRQISVIFFAIVALAATAFTFKGETYNVDIKKSRIHWIGKKATGQHDGYISFSQAALEFDKGKLTGGSFTVDMNSITCTDITDAETNGKFIGHLKADDFFGVASHPVSTLKITKVEAKGKKYNITADLTIKGKTNPVTFEAEVNEKGGKGTAKATVTVDRTKYDIRYGSKSFFDNLGDKFIYDEFTLELNLEFSK